MSANVVVAIRGIFLYFLVIKVAVTVLFVSRFYSFSLCYCFSSIELLHVTQNDGTYNGLVC
jgi:hypothetical protein